MARILLIKPRMHQMDRFATAASPPLGPLYLAAYARKHRPGLDSFRLIDERIEMPELDDYRSLLDSFQPDIIGLSVMTTESERLRELAGFLRSQRPSVPILVGGPHATAYGEELLNDASIDYVVSGEGETSWVRLLNAFDRGETHPQETISGLIYRRLDNTIYHVPYNRELAVVEDLPAPAWDLINFTDYEQRSRMTPTHLARYAPLFTSRGCPYKCTYCHDVFSKGFRAMSPSKVVDEIEALMTEQGIEEFEIYDDIFNADYKRAMAICNEIERRGLKPGFSFPNGVRGDRLSRELIEALRRAGTYHISFAVESASPRIQKLIKKHNNLEKLEENIAHAADVGIFAWGFFMLGFPTETREELWKTVAFASRSKLHGAFFFQVVPFGGTELAEGFFGDAPAMPTTGVDVFGAEPGQPRDASATGSVANDYHTTPNCMAEVSSLELSAIQAAAYMRFYYSPKRMVRMFRNFPRGGGELIRRGVGMSRYLAVEKPLRLARHAMRHVRARVPGRLLS